MNISAALDQYRGICSDVLNRYTTKLNKSFKTVFIETLLLHMVKPYWGNHFWSRGYFVNTVGLNEEMIRRYVRYQKDLDKKEENNSQHFTLFD